jgi:outer membrane receptor protein involved in Fe transport
MRLITTLAILLFTQITFAQRPILSVRGSVQDSLSKEPLEYATIILFNAQDSAQVAGIATNSSGAFKLDSLRPGQFFARVSFLGYDVKTISQIRLGRDQQQVDLGKILLAPTGLVSDEVNITTERLAVEYHVEKKVINVAQQNIAPTGTAADVLANAPSVTVDIEGNVKLRGSSNFTVMIDGRPSILDANDALQQIPSGSIDKIEIITNPSSRFSAEGTAGIINIIPLRRGANGISGQINARTTLDERRGTDFTFSRPLGKSALTFGGNIGVGRDPGDTRSETRTTFEDMTTTVKTDGSSMGVRDNYGFRAELDVPISESNSLYFGGRFGSHSFGRNSDLNTWETSDQTSTTFYSLSRNTTDRGGHHMNLFTNWKHRFPEEDHTLTFDASLGGRDGDDNVTTEQFAVNGDLLSGVKTHEGGPPTARLEIKTDYVRPLANHRKLEAGLSSQFGKFNSDNSNSVLDTLTDYYVEQTLFSNSTEFSRSLQAGYGMFSGQIKKLEYQLGLRGEYLDRTVAENRTDESVALARFDLYPSAHTALDLGESKQLSASYTRRVEHSRPWFLEPFISWDNSYNVRRGNPNLLPEFIDSYELGYQTELFGQFASVEGYYRVKHNNVEMLRSVYSENVTLTTPENVGRQFSLGTELRTDIAVHKGWSLGLSGNLYDQRVNGEAAGRSFDEHSFTYDAKLNNIMALTKSTKLQIDANYNGPQITSQGENEPNFIANAGIRQEFLNKSLNVALQVRDIFGSSKRESTTESPGIYSYEYFSQDAPVFTLSSSYVFNNFKKKRDTIRADDTGDDF